MKRMSVADGTASAVQCTKQSAWNDDKWAEYNVSAAWRGYCHNYVAEWISEMTRFAAE
jgi:hypothetical protein